MNLGKNIIKHSTLIHSQILFTRCQFYVSFMVSNPLFLVFISSVCFVPAQKSSIYLPLFFFAHLILNMLGVFYLFFTFGISEVYLDSCWMSGVGFLQKIVNGFRLLIVFANDFSFDVSLGYEFTLGLALSQ